jgi:DNA-binding beta-propeller fold protein YncE
VRTAALAAASWCLALAGGPGVASAAAVFRYDGVLEGDPPLRQPVSVTLEPRTGELCVADAASQTIDVFDAHGLHRFQTNRMAALSMPMDASVDSSGGFVFTDAARGGGRTIRRLDFLGEPEPYEPQLPRPGWNPTHLLLTSDGGYVTVDAEGLLAKHDAATGALLWMTELVEPSWERADLLGRPAESPGGRIYVPNPGVGAVEVVEADGSGHVTFGSRGTKRGELMFPVGVAFGPGGLVLVLDRGKQCVVGFDPAHQFAGEFGRFGLRTGELYFPVAIAAAGDGRVWIAQGFEGRVQIFRLGEPDSAEPALGGAKPSPAGEASAEDGGG